jgi:hypothetical protein
MSEPQLVGAAVKRSTEVVLLCGIAATFSSPVAAQQRATPIEEWVTAADFPANATSGEGSVRVRYTIGTDGKATHCKVQYRQGDADLRDRICELIEQRGQYTPAYSKAGQPIEAEDELHIFWKSGQVMVGQTDFGGALPSNNPAMWETTDDVTPAIIAAKRIDVNLSFRIGVDGRVSDCVATAPNSNVANDLSCRLLRARARFHSPVGRDGNPIEAVGRTVIHWRSF